jgi:hypothetical protein
MAKLEGSCVELAQTARPATAKPGKPTLRHNVAPRAKVKFWHGSSSNVENFLQKSPVKPVTMPIFFLRA